MQKKIIKCSDIICKNTNKIITHQKSITFNLTTKSYHYIPFIFEICVIFYNSISFYLFIYLYRFIAINKREK